MAKFRIPEQLVGVIFLLLILTGLAVGFFVINQHDPARARVIAEREHARVREDSIQQARAEWAAKREEWKREKEEREAKKKERELQQAEWEAERLRREAEKYPIESSQIKLHRFDPNIADSFELVHLGFPPRTAHSLLRYRAAGARFRKPEDVRKIHYVDDTLYAQIAPYIVLTMDSVVETAPFYPIKKDTILCLNTADTASLQLLRGIGRYSALQIVWHREKLGGYYSVEQLHEVPKLQRADSLMRYFTVDTTLITPLYINQLAVEQMMRHPYIRFEQAKAIREWRHKKGNISGEEILRQLKVNREPAFTEQELVRLRPYIRYDKKP